jgi:hypothetical protein
MQQNRPETFRNGTRTRMNYATAFATAVNRPEAIETGPDAQDLAAPPGTDPKAADTGAFVGVLAEPA